MLSQEQLGKKLLQVMADIKEAVDLSIQLRKESPAQKKEVTILWQHFLAEFLDYIRQKGKETGENLLAGIAFQRARR